MKLLSFGQGAGFNSRRFGTISFDPVAAPGVALMTIPENIGGGANGDWTADTNPFSNSTGVYAGIDSTPDNYASFAADVPLNVLQSIRFSSVDQSIAKAGFTPNRLVTVDWYQYNFAAQFWSMTLVDSVTNNEIYSYYDGNLNLAAKQTLECQANAQGQVIFAIANHNNTFGNWFCNALKWTEHL